MSTAAHILHRHTLDPWTTCIILYRRSFILRPPHAYLRHRPSVKRASVTTVPNYPSMRPILFSLTPVETYPHVSVRYCTPGDDLEIHTNLTHG